MVQPPNWQEIEDTLFETGKTTIERFGKEHPQTVCSFFVYYVYLSEGVIELCLDIPQNALHEAMRLELVQIERRNKMLNPPTSWHRASYYTEIPPIVDYAYSAGRFQYASYAMMTFEGWSEFRRSEAYPQAETTQDDYLEGNIRIVIWKVCERLIQERAFLHLRLSSPFRVGYQFHERPLHVLRILNWPNAQGAPFYSVLDSPLAQER